MELHMKANFIAKRCFVVLTRQRKSLKTHKLNKKVSDVIANDTQPQNTTTPTDNSAGENQDVPPELCLVVKALSPKPQLIEKKEEQHQNDTQPTNPKPEVTPNQPTNVIPNQPISITPNQPTNIIPNQQTNIIPNQQTNVTPNQQKNITPNQQKNIIPNQEINITPNQQKKHHTKPTKKHHTKPTALLVSRVSPLCAQSVLRGTFLFSAGIFENLLMMMESAAFPPLQ